MGLPSSSLDAVNTLANKDQFRNCLSINGYNTPNFKIFDTFQGARDFVEKSQLLMMVKPVDSSGSKGISKVIDKGKFDRAFASAMEYSRCKRIIVEEFIDKKYPQIHGDGFVFNDELVFTCLGDQYFGNDEKIITPISTMMPSQCDPDYIERGLRDLKSLLKKLKYGTGPINIELMVGRNNNVYIMEIGPRNGGNFVPQFVQFATGANIVSWAYQSALGILNNKKRYFKKFQINGCYSHYILHSNVEGNLRKIEIDKFVQERLLMKQM
ncbi:hypothetical protein OAT93_00425 [bacterium]|nr:hypothetical protein [bacterium]